MHAPLNRCSSVVKTRTSVREIPGSILTKHEFSVWKESSTSPYKCDRALLVFSEELSPLLYTKPNEPALGQNT